MFWSSELPLDAFAGEPAPLAAARASLASAAMSANVDPTNYWGTACDAMHSIYDGWTVGSCGSSLPNTHWHIQTKDSLWMGYRVAEVRRTETTYDGRWSHLTAEQRILQLVESVWQSPMSLTLTGLMDEITRHGTGIGDHLNTYPYGEVHALSMILGMDHPDVDDVLFLDALGGFPAAHALADTRGGLYPAHKSARLPQPTLF